MHWGVMASNGISPYVAAPHKSLVSYDSPAADTKYAREKMTMTELTLRTGKRGHAPNQEYALPLNRTITSHFTVAQ